MIASKDAEIQRLTEERNFYQRKLFPDRKTSDMHVDAVRDEKRALAGGGSKQKPRG